MICFKFNDKRFNQKSKEFSMLCGDKDSVSGEISKNTIIYCKDKSIQNVLFSLIKCSSEEHFDGVEVFMDDDSHKKVQAGTNPFITFYELSTNTWEFIFLDGTKIFLTTSTSVVEKIKSVKDLWFAADIYGIVLTPLTDFSDSIPKSLIKDIEAGRYF